MAEQEKTRDRLDVDGFAAPADDVIQDEFVSSNVVDSPQQEEVPTKSKPRMRRRYVRRGKTWLRAIKVATKPGENIFVRNAPGKFEKIGTVDANGRLPAAYVEE